MSAINVLPFRGIKLDKKLRKYCDIFSVNVKRIFDNLETFIAKYLSSLLNSNNTNVTTQVTRCNILDTSMRVENERPGTVGSENRINIDTIVSYLISAGVITNIELSKVGDRVYAQWNF